MYRSEPSLADCELAIDQQLNQLKEQILKSVPYVKQLYQEIGSYSDKEVLSKICNMIQQLGLQFSDKINEEIHNLENTRDGLLSQLNELIQESSDICKHMGYTYDQYIQIFCTSVPLSINPNSLNGQIDLHKYYADSISNMESNRLQLLSTYVDEIKHLCADLDDEVDDKVIDLSEDLTQTKENELKEEINVLTDLKNKRKQTITLLCEQMKKILLQLNKQELTEMDQMILSDTPTNFACSIKVIDQLKEHYEALKQEYKQVQQRHKQLVDNIKKYVSILTTQLSTSSLPTMGEVVKVKSPHQEDSFSQFNQQWNESMSSEFDQLSQSYSSEAMTRLEEMEKLCSTVLMNNIDAALEKQREFIIALTNHLSKFMTFTPKEQLEVNSKPSTELFYYYNDYIQSLYQEQKVLEPMEHILNDYKQYIETDIKSARSDYTKLIIGRKKDQNSQTLDKLNKIIQFYEAYEKSTAKSQVRYVREWQQKTGRELLYNGEPMISILESFNKRSHKK